MTGFKRIGFLLVCCACALMAFPKQGFAQTDQAKMTYDEYKVKLAEFQKREADAKAGLMECKKAGDALSKQISDIDAQVAQLKQDVYQLVGSDENGVNEFLQELDRIEARLMGMRNLTDDALFDHRDELDQIVSRLGEMKKDKRALLPAAQTKLASIDQLVEQVNARMPRKRIRQYSVLKGDSLWKIAKKKDIYNDPYMWPRIYVENRDKIKDPNVIYPKWVLNVPFGVDLNQYLVMRGDNLSSISSKVYKDITKWNRIYQANKKQILDPSLIFPAQVLDIPAK
jgi:nucleoid-associated protein YgaU